MNLLIYLLKVLKHKNSENLVLNLKKILLNMHHELSVVIVLALTLVTLNVDATSNFS